MHYAVRLTKDDNGTILVTFPDVPEAVTFGDTKEEALARAPDALATAIEIYIKDRRPLPEPSASKAAGPVVEIPPVMAVKVALYQAMRQQKVGKAELARRLHWHLPQVDRLLDVRHASRIDQLAAGLGAVGKRLLLTVEDAPVPAAQAPVGRSRSRKAARGPRETPRCSRSRRPRPRR